MARLSATDILDVHARGHRADSLDRALLVLRATTGSTLDTLAALPIGRRDHALFTAHAETFGDAIPCVVPCPFCATPLELALGAQQLRLEPPDEGPGPFALAFNETTFTFRLPNTHDLRFALAEPDAVEARLLERCVEGPVPEEEVANAISAEMGRLDPQADVQLALTCPSCHGAWSAPFDIAGYLWREIETEAERLLDVVHVLAKSYGWSEAAILDMPATRHRAYLERLEAW
ncbi:MAG: hypothetical protein AAGA48_20680 [Myxococcota bacterium]